MNYGFHAEANLEFADAIHHYLAIDSRLAESFISEIEHAVSTIRRNPLTWRIVEGDVRRYLVQRFPFGIYYTVETDFITIWAILHLSREPDY
jgi:plasmid stabilization system protein ParE